MRAKDFHKNEPIEREAEKASPPSQLYVDALRTRPRTSNTDAVLAELTNRLDRLAQKAGIPVSEFLSRAESNPDFSEDYLEALTTARQLARLKLNR